MKSFTIGIDSGSTMCKIVLLTSTQGSAQILDTQMRSTGWNPKASATLLFETLLNKHGLTATEVDVFSTGYGRESIDFAQKSFTEITCHAMGGVYLNPEIQGIIDIGGQDSKVIRISNGKVSDFFMNDKCAAGTGRFLSMVCERLEIPFSQIDAFSNLVNPAAINSMCAVFAESEIIGLLSAQTDRAEIMAGALISIASRIALMAGKLQMTENRPVLMTGGLAHVQALPDLISKALKTPIVTHSHSQYAGALGACICGNR